ncbi:hypothetical protein DH2020_031963 [Rehmannia glutinosa]|uniref:F-box domain-containing protein n=1 Tax=Rehmannia glutinosa TaxID=99300 RepID=A0ABR0VIY4_REHGL
MELKTIRFPIVLSSSDDDEEPQETATDSQETDIRFYPEPIIEEILYRVPAKTVLYWKTVCKTWLSIIDDPTFSKTHFSRAPFALCLFSPIHRARNPPKSCTSSKAKLFRILIQESAINTIIVLLPREQSFQKFQGSEHVPLLPLNSNVISCEGIVCWASNTCTCCCGTHIFICNPITGEYITFLPLSNDQEYNNDYVFIGIGFCRASKKFKILRMYEDEDEDEDEVWWPEVLTVADKTRWRRVGFGTSLFDFAREIEEVVYVNGAIYWRYDGDSYIFTFHFERVLFYVISTKISAPKNLISLGVLGNSLCVSMFSPYDRHVELWVMDAYGDDDNVHWHKLYNVETETTRLEHSGVLGSRAI